MLKRNLARPGSFGLHRHFAHLEEFIQRAQAGDTYRETSRDGMAVVTFKARSRRVSRGVLRAERIVTDLVARGDADYAYRTRSSTGNLFDTRDRHDDPAFLAIATRGTVLDMTEVGCREHSVTFLESHHSRVTDAYPNGTAS